MQTGFGKAEQEEMDEEKFREARRSFEAEFGGDDAEEFVARTRTISEEVDLVSSSGPPYFDAVTGEQLPEDLVEKGKQAERESLEKFPVYVDAPEEEVSEVGGQLIKSRWVFTRKSADRVKGRIVAQQLNLGEWADTFAATPTSLGQRLLLKIASEKGLVVKFGDISCAFPYAHLPPEEKIYLLPPKRKRGLGRSGSCCERFTDCAAVRNTSKTILRASWRSSGFGDSCPIPNSSTTRALRSTSWPTSTT